MATVRKIRKAKAFRKPKTLLLTNYRRLGTFGDGCAKFVLYFKSSNGMDYVWTPNLQGETLRLFQLISQVKPINQTPVKAEQTPHRHVTDYVSLAIRAANIFHQKTPFAHVNEVAKGLFKFDIGSNLRGTMPDIVSQEIYDWVITLSEQPIDEEEKLRLAKKFIASLALASSPVENLVAL